jgi:putative toxin-antitoxin system antitoxin component (TIGR02293 family)
METGIEQFNHFLKKGRPGEHAYVVLLGLNVFDPPALMKLIAKGLPLQALQRFVRNTGLTVEQVAELIDIPKRTFARRKAQKRLTPGESDRLVRAARIYSRALALYDGNAPLATEWFTAKIPALGGVTPIEYARTEVGATEVDHLIGRIEYGIFS